MYAIQSGTERDATVMNHNRLSDEPGRLAALERYRILDTPREESFDAITALVRDVLDVPISAVSLIDVNRQWFKSLQGLGITETPRDISFCGHTILNRAPMIVPDATIDTRFATNPLVTGDPNIRAYAGVPLCSPDGYNFGSLCAIDTRPREFNDTHIAMLAKFAGLVVNEMELRTIAHRDFLTGAATRRAFIDAAGAAIERLHRYDRISALLMFDLDHFKKINDGFGHPAGDDVLKAVAAACLGTLRPGDMLGRLGGEEFGILLTEIDATGAVAVAEHLRAQIAALRFGWAPDLRITASFGASALRSGHSVDTWVAVTDAALYRAKHEGRNRIVYGDDLPHGAISD